MKSLQMSLLLPFLTLIKSRIGEDVAYEDRRFSRVTSIISMYMQFSSAMHFLITIAVWFNFQALAAKFNYPKYIKTKINPDLLHEIKITKSSFNCNRIFNNSNGWSHSLQMLYVFQISREWCMKGHETVLCICSNIT